MYLVNYSHKYKMIKMMQNQNNTVYVTIVLTEHTDKESFGIFNIWENTIFNQDKLIYSCVVLSLPYRDNKKYISRIPDGHYNAMILPKSTSFNYQHIWIQNVKNRTGIKIHIGNYAKQLKGCFVIGKSGTIRYVNNSEDALNEVISLLPNSFDIELITG